MNEKSKVTERWKIFDFEYQSEISEIKASLVNK